MNKTQEPRNRLDRRASAPATVFSMGLMITSLFVVGAIGAGAFAEDRKLPVGNGAVPIPIEESSPEADKAHPPISVPLLLQMDDVNGPFVPPRHQLAWLLDVANDLIDFVLYPGQALVSTMPLKVVDAADGDPDDLEKVMILNGDVAPAEAESPLEASLSHFKTPLTWLLSSMIDVTESVMGWNVVQEVEVKDGDPIVLQFVQMLSCPLKSELSFVRLICGELTEAQREAVREAAMTAVKQQALAMAKAQMRMAQGIEELEEADVFPNMAIREAILNVMEQSISREQVDAYREEMEKRGLKRKEAIILALVCQLDRQLFLSDEQRDSVRQRLGSAWKPTWESWAPIISEDSQYLPPVPDDCVTPFLNDDQKILYSAYQRSYECMWWGNGEDAPNPEEDEWWGLKLDVENQVVPVGLQILGLPMEAVIKGVDVPEAEED